MTASARAAANDRLPLAEAILDVLVHRIGKDERAARPHDWLAATILTVRDEIIDKWMASTRATHAVGAKRVYYLSLEFLIGRLLRDAIANLQRNREVSQALGQLGVSLAEIEEIEPDAALGNGGLGRLAACFMESLATLDVPAYGYGIRYVNGMFRQRIDDGWQVELPETWLAHGNPWEFERRESAYCVGFGGEVSGNERGQVHWKPAEAVGGGGGRYAGRRLARQAGEYTQAVERARVRSDRTRCVQRRRPYRCARRAEPR